jgi:hypothetical protein
LTRPRQPGNVGAMIRRRRTLLLGLALLLVVGSVVAILWTTPCEADRKAALIRKGMTKRDVFDVMGPQSPMDDMLTRIQDPELIRGTELAWLQEDRSALHVGFRSSEAGAEPVVVYTWTREPPPVHPLTRLRRTLARVLPFLGE